MKKIIKTFSLIFVTIFSALIIFANMPLKNANASSSVSLDFYNTVNTVLKGYVKYKDRVAGTEGEKLAAEYIETYLKDNTNLEPLVNSYISDGRQEFNFESTFDGLYHTSQNIIYTYKSKTETNQKVIIGCSYDSFAYKFGEYQYTNEVVSSESVNASAGSVALLLALAKHLPFDNLPYNVEIIFFGAGGCNNAGSNFYTQGISKDDAKNILLMINLDKVALGKNVYFYVDEIENDFSKFVSNITETKNLDVRKVSTNNLGKIALIGQNKLGLNYTHIALTSNNINFMSSNVLTMNIFAGDYSSGISVGLNEYDNKEVITYTENDNLEYIAENYGESVVADNLFSVYEAITTIITDSDFVSNCVKSFGQTNWLYVIFGNQKLVSYLTSVAVIVLIGVSFFIYYKLTKS